MDENPILCMTHSRRGGRPKRFVEVTPKGVRALAQHGDALLRVREGLDATLGNA